MRPTPTQDKDSEIAAFVDLQEKREAELKKAQEKRRLDEIRNAEAEIKESLEREERKTAVAQTRKIAKQRIRYNLDIVMDICERISAGEVLKSICDDQSMPEMATVQDWLEDPSKEGFRELFLKACKRREEVFADDLIIIADDSRNDYMEKLNQKTGETFRVLDPEALGRSKLRIDMRLKLLKASDPSKWGDNPTTADKAKSALEKNMRPNVVFNFHEAPKLQPGDDAKVINQASKQKVVTLEQLRDKDGNE